MHQFTCRNLGIFSLTVLLLACYSLLHSTSAFALDPFNTEAGISKNSLDISAEDSRCAKEKISAPLSLAEVIDLTLCNNPQTRSLWAASKAQAAQVGVSTAAYLPTLSAQVSVNQNFPLTGGQATDSYTSKTANVTANYLLYDFGGRSASLENARQLLIAVNATRNATLQNNYLSAVQAYYGLLAARSSVQTYRIAEASAKESLAAAEARYKAGVVTPVDKLQAQTNLSQATYNRINTEGLERNAQGVLANLMGFDATYNFALQEIEEVTPDPVVEQDIGKLIEVARHNRADLYAAESQIQAAEAQVNMAKASGRPNITLGAVAGYSDTPSFPDNRNNSFGVTLSVPLFNGFKTTYQVRSAEAQLEGKVAERDRLANQIALEVWKAYQTMLTSSIALRATDDLLQVATQSEKMILGRYKAGVGNILDTLSAQTALANARQQRVGALYNFLISRFALAQAIGQLDLTQTESGN